MTVTTSAGSLDRFYAPGPWVNGAVRLSPEEVHHLTRVMRAKAGDLIEVFDGEGARATARVENISKRDVELKVMGDVVLKDRTLPAVLLAVASPKGERLKWLVEKCTELGIDELVPLRTQRSVVEPGDAKLHKLDQTVIAACKQSRRDRLMTISPVQGLAEFLQQRSSCRVIYGDAAGQPLETLITEHRRPDEKVRNMAIVVGPEGGLTTEEQELLRGSGAVPLAIGENILRVETAAVALSAVLMSLFRGKTV